MLLTRLGPVLILSVTLPNMRKTIAKVIHDSADQSARLSQSQELLKAITKLQSSKEVDSELVDKIEQLEKALFAAEAMVQDVVRDVLSIRLQKEI